MDRKAAVAGRFYTANSKELKRQIQSFLINNKKRAILGAISPHAGYIYSGKTAGTVYSYCELTNTVIFLSPNHTGMGPKCSLMSQGKWETPFGGIEIDQEFSRKLMKMTSLIEEDELAHFGEHSIEVQLPFLQVQNPLIKFVPITMYPMTIQECKTLGESIAKTIKSFNKNYIIVASSDMTHYKSAEEARDKDFKAIREIEKLSPETLYSVVQEFEISMCGYIPATVMLYATKYLGAKKATLLSYSNSGETSGDFEQVVGYAGIIVE